MRPCSNQAHRNKILNQQILFGLKRICCYVLYTAGLQFLERFLCSLDRLRDTIQLFHKHILAFVF